MPQDPQKFREAYFGAYLLRDLLGEGGMGRVYLADAPDGSTVALKVIKPERLGDPATVRRFLREIRAVERLDDPNIVRSLGTAEQDGKLALILEHVPGGVTLLQYVRTHGQLPLPLACEFIRQAAVALQHVHDRGLVHRDVKPGNILIAGADTPGPTVKLLDLGLALLAPLAGDVTASTGVTPEGAVLGTPDYLAPEQALRPHEVDHRADLYSLGCTFYFLLSGKPPFPGGNLGEKIAGHLSKTPKLVEERRPGIPKEIVAVLRKLMAKKPEDRYASAAEVALALADWSDAASPTWSDPLRSAPAEPTETGSETVALELSPPHRRWWRLHPRAALALGLATVVLVGLAAWFLFLSPRPDGDNLSPLDRLRAEDIPEDQRQPDQPAELVAVFGDGRLRNWHAPHGLAVSPDGAHVACGDSGGDAVLRVWDLKTGRQTAALHGCQGIIASVAWAPTGELVAATSTGDDTVRLWDVSAAPALAKAVLSGFKGHPFGVAFSSDGKQLAAGCFDKTVRIWKLDGDRPTMRALLRHPEEVRRLTFGPGDRTLVAGTGTGFAVWDLSKTPVSPLSSFQGSNGRTAAVGYAPDGRIFATGSTGSVLQLWDMSAKPAKLLATQSKHAKTMNGAATLIENLSFSTDQKLLATAAHDATIRIWDLPGLSQRHVLQTNDYSYHAAFLPNSHTLVANSTTLGPLRLWDADAGKEITSHSGHPMAVFLCGVAPDGSSIVSWSGGGNLLQHDVQCDSVKTWVKSNRFQHAETTPDDWQQAETMNTLSSDGRTLLLVHDDRLRVIDLPTGTETASRLERTPSDVHSMAVASGGSRLACLTKAGGVQTFDVATGKLLAEGKAPGPGWVWFAPDGELFAMHAGNVQIYETKSAKQLATFDGGSTAAVAFSPDSDTVAIHVHDETWDGAKGSNLVQFWSRSQGAITGRIPAGLCRGVAWSKTGDRLAVANLDREVAVWDVADKRKLHSLRLPGPAYSIAYADDGRHLITGNGNGTVYVLRLPKKAGE